MTACRVARSSLSSDCPGYKHENDSAHALLCAHHIFQDLTVFEKLKQTSIGVTHRADLLRSRRTQPPSRVHGHRTQGQHGRSSHDALSRQGTFHDSTTRRRRISAFCMYSSASVRSPHSAVRRPRDNFNLTLSVLLIIIILFYF
jgi:hypothetical protein